MKPGRILLLLLAGTLVVSAGDSGKSYRKTRVRLGGISIGAGYSRYSGYYPWYGPWGYGYGYRPAYWAPYWSPYWDAYMPYFYPPYYSGLRTGGPGMGEVKLAAAESAEVYLDGAYAGAAKDLKTIWLEPGAYDLEVRSQGGKYSRRIYVLSGKRLRIDAMETKP